MKRILVVLCVVLMALAGGYYFYVKSGKSFSGTTSAFRAVPVDAPVFIEFASLNEILADHEITTGSGLSHLIPSFYNLATRIDSLISHSEHSGKALHNHPFILVFNLEGKGRITPLIIAEVESTGRRRSLEALFTLLFPAEVYDDVKRQYNGRKINDISRQGSETILSYSFSEGLLLVSPASLVVEKSIRQLDSESLPDNKLFKKVHKTATGQAEASVYINHSSFPELLKPGMNPIPIRKEDEFGETRSINYKEKVERFSGFAAWSELDLFTSDNEIRMSGVSVAPDSLNQYLAVLKNQDPVRGNIDEMMPGNTAFYYSLAFSKKDLFFKDMDAYFTHSDVFYKREEKLKRMDSEVRAAIKPLFEELVDDEIALVGTEISGDGSERTTFFIVSVTSNSVARERMLGWLQQYASQKNIDFGQLTAPYQIDRETGFTLYSFPYPSFPGIWLGAPFYAASAEYFVFRDNYILFSSNRTSLENLLHDLTLGATLTEDAAYSDSKKKIETKANISFYLDVNYAYKLTERIFSETLISLFKEEEEALRKFSALNWQVVSTGPILFNNIVLDYPGEIREDAQTTWHSNIGSPVDFKPQLVINHDDPGNREIILQDRSNRLHLITSEGRVRWSLEIPGRILGKIHQVDCFRNGKLQFLFNTKDKIYRIDRLGNHVSPFPIALRSPATNGLNVFDYDNNRKYRFFLAGEDKKIYVYDGSGKIVSGWQFEGTDHEVTTPVQHFRVEGKDYIVFKDTSRIYVQHRRGDTRVRTVDFENSRNPILLKTEGTPKMVTTDSQGRVYYLYFDGSFAKEFRNEISCPPSIYTFSSEVKKIGVADKAANRIYLYNSDGSLHQRFPLQGNSAFSIGKITDGVPYFNLIVGSHNGNIYNYRLD